RSAGVLAPRWGRSAIDRGAVPRTHPEAAGGGGARAGGGALRRLTDQERVALREVGPPGEGPVSPEVFDEFIRLGWGCWAIRDDLLGRLFRRRYWKVTAAGRLALELDDLARQS
ncbi:MAG TPA: hypothetical protein VJY33_13290, partial [Isosphaeraceae bacterium]|nr:hypothetical protein [Isosphaeraceae bacterium]